MADTKITKLNAIDRLNPTQLLLIVDDPSGNPVNKNVTVETFFNGLAANNLSIQSFSKLEAMRTIKSYGDIFLQNQPRINPPSVIKVVGLDDLQSGGIYSGTTEDVYYIEIVGSKTGSDSEGFPSDQFVWFKSDGIRSSVISIDPISYQLLDSGVSVKFASNVGHVVGDVWNINISRESRIVFNGTILAEDLTSLDNMSSVGAILHEDGHDISLEDNLYIAANTTTISVVGDCSLGTSSDKIGFFGTAPVSQNTSMSSVTTVEDLRDELIRLGLIA